MISEVTLATELIISKSSNSPWPLRILPSVNSSLRVDNRAQLDTLQDKLPSVLHHNSLGWRAPRRNTSPAAFVF